MKKYVYCLQEDCFDVGVWQVMEKIKKNSKEFYSDTVYSVFIRHYF